MKRIISVSRRTDIPAFYGDWFMGRLKTGFVGVAHPFGGQKYVVSLKPEDVTCLVFWSKNFTPFLENLKTIESMGYKFYFNYTGIFEANVDKRSAIDTLKLLSRTYSPQHINWRFDPIIVSTICGRDFFIKAFEELACEFEGFVQRCYFSFVCEYNKVKRNFQELQKATGVEIIEVGEDFKINLASELSAIAERHGIEMFSCCSDYLAGGRIKKAHCIDGSIIEKLFFPEGFQYTEKPTRAECGCIESIDIGTYDTCPHGCVYCYANANKSRAYESFRKHDKDSAFLGYGKSESDRWLAEVQNNGIEKDSQQLEIF